MAVKVEVVSGPKGGNPGGLCRIYSGAEGSDAYFKYVHGKRNGRGSSFRPERQPIYEGLTFQLARELGLRTPQTFVLDNRRRDVRFDNWKLHMNHDPSGRDFYFVSYLVPHPRRDKTDELEVSSLETERLYLEALLISDVIGRTPNYSFIRYNGNGQLTYLDLGCSFVHAKEGFLSVPHDFKDFNTKEYKRQLRKLRGKILLTSDGREINLNDLVENLPVLRIPFLNNLRGRVPLGSIVSGEEFHDIQYYLAKGLVKSLSSFRKANLLV